MHKSCDSHVKIVLYFIITIPKVIYKIYDTNHNGCRDLELLRFREGCTCFRVSGVGLIAPCSKLGIEIISKHSGSTISVIAAKARHGEFLKNKRQAREAMLVNWCSTARLYRPLSTDIPQKINYIA